MCCVLRLFGMWSLLLHSMSQCSQTGNSSGSLPHRCNYRISMQLVQLCFFRQGLTIGAHRGSTLNISIFDLFFCAIIAFFNCHFSNASISSIEIYILCQIFTVSFFNIAWIDAIFHTAFCICEHLALVAERTIWRL